MCTPPSQPLNAQFPQSFNPHVPSPYFTQYPPTNSPSAHSTDSSILLALQKQWERQERLDLECNKMEKQKEERKEWKKKGNKEKKAGNEPKNVRTSKGVESTKPSKRSPGLMAPIPVIALIGWNKLKHWWIGTKDGSTEKSCCSTVEPVCPKWSTHCHKELLTRKLRTQFWGITQISGPCCNDQTHTISCTRSLMKHYKHIIQGMPRSLT